MSRCKRKLRKKGAGRERDVGVGPEETFSISAKEVSGHRSLKLTTLLCPTVTPSLSLFFFFFAFFFFFSLCLCCLSAPPPLSLSPSFLPSALCHFYLKRGRVIFFLPIWKMQIGKVAQFYSVKKCRKGTVEQFYSNERKMGKVTPFL